MSGVVSGGHDQEGGTILSSRDAGKYPTMHRRAAHSKELSTL